MKIITLIILSFFVLQKSFAQDYKEEEKRTGLSIFYAPESGVRGMIKPSADAEIFNPMLFFSITKNEGNGYKNISERRRFYVEVNDSLKGISKWFAAAKIVTQKNSLGAAQGFNFWTLKKEAANFIRHANAFLFVFNQNIAKQLLDSGKVNRSFFTANFKDSSRKLIHLYQMKGKDLDEGLVMFEQSMVQEFISIYQQQHPQLDMNPIFKSINKAMYHPFAPKPIKSFLKRYFKKKKSFQFQEFENRVRLGNSIIERFY